MFARKHNYIDWNDMVDQTNPSEINKLEDDVMEAYGSALITSFCQFIGERENNI